MKNKPIDDTDAENFKYFLEGITTLMRGFLDTCSEPAHCEICPFCMQNKTCGMKTLLTNKK